MADPPKRAVALFVAATVKGLVPARPHRRLSFASDWHRHTDSHL